MAFWEFLIQKEGDRSWLPLESPTVEILEGRYRVVARSSRVHTPVEIRVIQNATPETPPVRRIQKRLSQTNQDGLMVVMPFTRLAPGEWELRCGSDVMADMMGEGWLYRVQLQVLPIDLEADETLDDWEPDWQKEPPLNEAAQTSPMTPQTEQASEPELASAPALLPEPQPESASPSPSEPGEPFGTLADLPPVLQLRLERETYVVKRGLPLMLNGQILSEPGLGETVLNGESQPLAAIVMPGGKLRVRLFDPQTSRILVDETQLLAEYSSAPSPSPAFSITLALPAHRETHLLLGELTLYGDTEENSPPLATQSFSVTTDLLELLEAIANDFPEPEPEPAKPAVPFVPTPAPLIEFRPALQQPLPPLLHNPDPAKEPRRSLQLPKLADPLTGAQPEADISAQPNEIASDLGGDRLGEEVPGQALAVTEAVGTEPVGTGPEAGAATEVAQANPSSQSLSELQPQLELVNEAGDPAIDWQKVEPQVPLWQKQAVSNLSPDQPQTPEDTAFRALNLQERFLERLQALAADPELAEWLSTLHQPESGDDDSPAIEVGLLAHRSQGRAIGLDAELAAQEIVVDEPFFKGDRPPAAPPSHLQPAASASASASTLISASTALADVLTEEPIAPPQLNVPAGELVAGQTVDIAVKIPDTYARISVKLWTHDRQSRTLLDGPHWLMDFSPDGLGHLVGKTQIMVPFGCLEVQLEAIAMDMTTQLESDKVSVIRSVIPPDLNAISAVL